MATGFLNIDLGALVSNWQALNAKCDGKAGAVVKANGYGLGSGRVAGALAAAGATKFFVAAVEEANKVRMAVGQDAEIYVFSGHAPNDTHDIVRQNLIPLINSLDQMTRHFENLPGHDFGIQLDSGMNRLGMEMSEWQAVAPIALAQNPKLVMSHLACADEPDHPMNAYQLDVFNKMTDGIAAPRSLAATGGILLGKDYHFDVTRPGIGMYGAAPFQGASPVVTLKLPIIQTRDLSEGEVVGYGNSWQATRPSVIATVAGGYADGILRSISNRGAMWAGSERCPIVGRVSMDLITVDVTDLNEVPEHLTLIGPHQTVDDLADVAGTIGYEILTSLAARYKRNYVQP